MERSMILAALVVLLLAVILFLLNAHSSRRQRRLAGDASIAEDEQQEIEAMKAAQRKGLDKATIEALPIFIYKSSEQEHGSSENLQGSADNGEACSSSKVDIDCPVCLCEFQHNERGRELPNCQHRFHVDCIDTWLRSNATCPVCRASCGAGGDAEVALQVISNHTGIQYPTNVLFWGSNSRVSSRVRIEAPSSSSAIQVSAQELPIHGAASPSSPSLSLSLSSPSPSSTLNPLRRLLISKERSANIIGSIVSNPIGSHSHIVLDISIKV